MIAYIIRRLFLLPIVLIGLSLLIFGMMQLLSPYDRLSTYVRDPAQLKQGPEVLKQLMDKYGLNDPIWVQYGRWLNNVIHGNLGYSESANMEVTKAIMRFLPATAQLALFAAIPVVFGGIWLGMVSAVHHNGLIDHTTRIMALTGWSLPTFVMGLLLLMIFYGWLGWFPSGELSNWAARIVDSPQFVRYTGMNAIDAILNGNLAVLGDTLRHLILPVFTLAYVQWALLLRVMRSSMLETLRQDYITTARAKGVAERVVIKKHARANALLPVITIAGVMVAGLLRGVVITETIFNYHGLGLFAVQAAQQLDFSAIIGFALFTGMLMILTNLIVDLLYAYIDPRVKLG
ncbi:ABC transporter permease [Candidatus Acetothermia bacterium]|nr:ABC transporter permease [Candidatus Bipolaricaulota bacterium]RLE41200.1 MAG: ABC transporter permease [Candidatus Acetothermia bacterium]